jgi:hypothetical protein
MVSRRRFYKLKFTIGKDTYKEINNISAKECQKLIPELFNKYYGLDNITVSYDKVWNLANRPQICDMLFSHFVKVISID